MKQGDTMKIYCAHRVAPLVLIIALISLQWVRPVHSQTSPLLEVDVTELDFGETETSLTLSVTNGGGGTLAWSLSEDEEWISADPTDGSLTAALSETVTVTVDRTKVSIPGEVTGVIAITSNDGDAEIGVRVIIGAPILAVDPSELYFGETETSLTFTVTNEGGGTLAWSLSDDEAWISAAPTGGSLAAALSETVTVTVDRSGLFFMGTVSGALTVEADGASATVTVTMMPLRTVGPASLDFGSEDVVKELFINNRGTGGLSWTVTTSEVWLSTDAGSGTTDEGMIDVIQVMVDRSAVTALGSYSDLLEIASSAGDITVPVAMEKENHPPYLPAPIAPPDGATDQSLAVTLSCRGGDAEEGEGDIVTYDIYFSSTAQLVEEEDSSVLVCSDMSTCYCDPGRIGLDNATAYYWKAVARDGYGAITSGDVWSFTTAAPPDGVCPAFALGLADDDIGHLRRLRDEILSGDEEGRAYIETYYRHGWELFLLLLTSRELRIEAREIAEELLPVSQSLLAHEEACIARELSGRVTAFLREISGHVRPQLKKVLSALADDLQEREHLLRFGITVRDSR